MEDIDYRKLLRIEGLSYSGNRGKGVRIAILDSGTPYVNVGKLPASTSHGIFNPVDDEFGHSTEISSIIFGACGIGGICEMAEPVFIKVLDDKGRGSIKSVSEGIDVALKYKCDVINLSLGFTRTDKCPKQLEDACERAHKAGVPVICSSGNDFGKVNWPAALKTTVCVGSSSENGLRAPFSSIGEVDFIAPGTDLPVIGQDRIAKNVSGTSYSAAIVTGFVALLISEMRTSRSKVSIDDIMSCLKKIAVDVDREGWDEMTGFGLVSGSKGDITLDTEIRTGFFDKIVCNIRGILGHLKKEKQNG